MPKIIKKAVNGGGGSGETTTVSISVSQANHNFSIFDAIYFDGTIWQLAISNSLLTVGTNVVSSIKDDNTFIRVLTGSITGLTVSPGETYYVSDTTPGLLTVTESNIYSNPLFIATSSVGGDVFPDRSQDIGGSSQTVARSNYDSVNLQYLYTGHANPGSATSSAVWRISRYDFSNGIIEFADGDQLYNNIYSDRESITYS
jgi:hypothetical protein